MRRKVRDLSTAATMIGLLALVSATPVPAAEFTAELVRSSEGEEGDVSKVFIKGDLRREEVLDDEEVGAISIARPDKGVVWTLMPEEKMYMALPLTANSGGASVDTQRLQAHTDMKVLGKEELSGFECEVREYFISGTSQSAVKLWYANSLDFPIKVVQFSPSGEIILEYRSIKVEAVPDSMFEIPPGYEKMGIPGMGQMPSGVPQYPGGE